MNLQAAIELSAGGPGSGCRGDSCGRPRIGWRPTMSLREAKEWNRDSVIKFKMYHGTTSENARQIIKNGFEVDKGFNDTVHQGHAIFITQIPSTASTFSGGKVLQVMVNVKKVYEEDDTHPERSTTWLRKNGYDAVVEYRGRSIFELAVLNPKNVVVLK